MLKKFAALLFVSLTLLSAPAFADWTGQFTITGIFMSPPGNYYFRVAGMPSQAACPNGATWGYIEYNDPGSQGFIAALLSAYTTGRSVALNVNAVNGFCHIIEAQFY